MLGPLWFVIFINDIDDAAELINIIRKFADDSKLGHRVQNDSDRQILQQTLDNLCEWADTWGMSFNLDKCKIIHLGRNNQNYNYTMNNSDLINVKEEKDIGVIVTKDLKPSRQCAEAAKTANFVLGQLRRAFHFRDRNIFIRLYKTYVRCHLEYSIPAWSPWNAKDKELLERVQRRAVKMVSGLKGTTYEERLKELNLSTLEERRVRYDMVETFKILNGFNDVNSDTWFRKVGAEPARETRLTSYHKNLVGSRSRLDIRQNFFSQRVVNSWNNIPTDIKESHNPSIFKTRYDRWKQDTTDST